MLPVTSRWARFGPTNRSWFIHVPRGGFCVSAFVVVRNRRGDVLLGRPTLHRDWPEEGCLPVWRVREEVRAGSWILPASHFLMDESPDHASVRISRKWAGLPGVKPRLVVVESHLFPTDMWAGTGPRRRRINHWALCFIFEVRTDRVPKKGPWWAELRFVPLSELSSIRIGRSHDDIIGSLLKARKQPAG